jgi:hypothetical protein
MEENKGLMTEFNSYVVENNPSPIMARGRGGLCGFAFGFVFSGN